MQHVLAIISCLKKLGPPEEGKSLEFPRKHAILADCTTIDYMHIYIYIYMYINVSKYICGCIYIYICI